MFVTAHVQIAKKEQVARALERCHALLFLQLRLARKPVEAEREQRRFVVDGVVGDNRLPHTSATIDGNDDLVRLQRAPVLVSKKGSLRRL